jgi:hypothetical protein
VILVKRFLKQNSWISTVVLTDGDNTYCVGGQKFFWGRIGFLPRIIVITLITRILLFLIMLLIILVTGWDLSTTQPVNCFCCGLRVTLVDFVGGRPYQLFNQSTVFVAGYGLFIRVISAIRLNLWLRAAAFAKLAKFADKIQYFVDNMAHVTIPVNGPTTETEHTGLFQHVRLRGWPATNFLGHFIFYNQFGPFCTVG